jgi:hypothetical protein
MVHPKTDEPGLELLIVLKEATIFLPLGSSHSRDRHIDDASPVCLNQLSHGLCPVAPFF